VDAPFPAMVRRRGAQSGPTSASARNGPERTTWCPHPQFIHQLATGHLGLLDQATRGPDGHAPECREWDNWWPVLQCTRCPRPLPTSDGGGTVWAHLIACRFLPKTEEVRRTRAALGPEALPPLPPKPRASDTMPADPSPIAGRGSLATCWGV